MTDENFNQRIFSGDNTTSADLLIVSRLVNDSRQMRAEIRAEKQAKALANKNMYEAAGRWCAGFALTLFGLIVALSPFFGAGSEMSWIGMGFSAGGLGVFMYPKLSAKNK